MICRHPQLYYGRNAREHTMKCTKYHHPGVSLTWRAQKSEQTGAPTKMHPRILARVHMSASRRKEDPGKVHLGSAEPSLKHGQVHFNVACPLLILIPGRYGFHLNSGGN